MKPLLNAVKSFEPASLLIDIDRDGGQKEKYLPVNARVMWALVWAKEMGQQLRIEDKQPVYDQVSKQMIAECNIWMVGEDPSSPGRLLASTVAGKFFDSEHVQTLTPVQDACTMAKGRALSNMGFATASCGLVPEHKDQDFAYNFRAVKGFEPSDYLIDIMNPGDTKPHKYMEVKYRMLWALMWATANKKKLRFREYIIGYDPASKIYTCGCEIKDEHDRIIATGIAGKYYDPLVNISDTPIQNACTAAKGRALASLGFGTFYGDTADDGDTSVPCDAGVPVMADNPFTILASGGRLDKNQEEKEEATQPADSNSDGEDKQPSNVRYTPIPLENALAFRMPSGKYAGKTLGELNVTEEGQKYLKYRKNDDKCAQKNPALYNAICTIAEYFSL